MDVNATLQEIRDLVGESQSGCEIDTDRLVELIEALDTWISRGGFLPKAWQTRRLTLS